VEVGQTVVKLKIHAVLRFLKSPKVRTVKGFSSVFVRALRDLLSGAARRFARGGSPPRHAPKAGALPTAQHLVGGENNVFSTFLL